MMKKNHLVSILFLFFVSFVCNAQILEPVKWKYSMSEPENGVAEISFEVSIDDGWHVYSMDLPPDGPVATKFVFETVQNAELQGQVECGATLVKKMEPTYNMELEWYEKSAKFTQKVNVKDDYYVAGYIEYMACDENTCLPPAKENFSFGVANNADDDYVEGEGVAADTADSVASPFAPLAFNDISKNDEDNSEVDYWKPVSGAEDMCEDGECDDSSVWSIFITGLTGGFIAIITPCVWPIIPMTVSFFLKRGKNPRKGRKAAIVYGLSIVLIYVLLGLLITLLFGAGSLNEIATNSVFNVFFFALLTLFALSFFGGFDLALPATWSTKIDNKADKTSGLFSILLMAFTLVIVSFSCTGPLIGTLLVQVSASKSLFAPAIGMLGFSLALAIPFTFFAFFPSLLHNLPRSGGWLNSVKVLLGFFELAFALKFLSNADLTEGWRILDREVFIALWIVIFALMGFYLLGKLRFRGDDPVEEVSVFRIIAAIGVFSFVVYLVPGMFGAPLKAVSAFVPPMSTQDMDLYSQQVHAQFNDFDDAMKYAKKNKKPVVVDFTGYACVNCREMEGKVWSNPDVSSMLTSDYVLVSLYTDSRRKLEEPFVVTENGEEKVLTTEGEKWAYLQRSKFAANPQPYYVLLDNKGELLNKGIGYTEDANEFIEFLKVGLKNYKDR